MVVVPPPSGNWPGHQFPLAQIQFAIEKLVLAARISLRGAERVCGLVAEFFGVAWETPHHTTVRTWLLRIGLYQLTRPKPQADDWVWLVDHTVQIGQEKCLVVLGVRLSELPPPGECLRFQGQRRSLKPVDLSNAEALFYFSQALFQFLHTSP